jgi:hypothetical protein
MYIFASCTAIQNDLFDGIVSFHAQPRSKDMAGWIDLKQCHG